MTLGENIKAHRMRAGLTQKDLSEKLSVSFQTISKWETDTNEPDIATLRKMCEIFRCSFDNLVNPKKDDAEREKKENVGDDEQHADSEENETVTENKEEVKEVPGASATKIPQHEMLISPQVAENNPIIGYCADCNKEIHQKDRYQDAQRNSSGMDIIVHVCEDCVKKHQELDKKYDALNQKLKSLDTKKDSDRVVDVSTKMLLVWSAIAAVAIFAVTLTVCLVKIDKVGVGWTAGLSILLAAGTFADVYCIFDGSYISDVFMAVASWSVRFPGLIFSLDFDGIVWLIAMKVVFAILSFCISCFIFFAAFAISSFLAIFSFVPILIKDLSKGN